MMRTRFARALRKFAGHDTAGKSAADDDRVDVVHVHFVELRVLHAHVSFCLSFACDGFKRPR